MTEHETLRSEIIKILKRDLYGPYFGDSEILELNYDETPLKRYLCGVLFPRDSKFESEDDDSGFGQESGTDTDDTEEGLIMSNTGMPSCAGMSFACSTDIKNLKIKISVGVYKRFEGEARDKEGKEFEKNIWKRSLLHWTDIISITHSSSTEIFPGLVLRIKVRKADKKGNVPITLSLINMQTVSSFDPLERAMKSFFQVYFSAEGDEGEKPFIDRKPFSETPQNPDIQSIDLLYRSVCSFAIGHGCAVNWKNDENGRTDLIESSFVPHQPTYPLVSGNGRNLPNFSIKEIIDSPPQKLKIMFDSLCREYNSWIKKRESEIPELSQDLREIAQRHIELCKESSSRIERGINILLNNELILKAFRLAHRAMLYQFAHSEWMKDGRPEGSKPKYDSSHAWRSFQIGFILQCLESVANPESGERDTMDLLWFPTGGGKTEAYLGLTAFVLFLRRLREAQKGKSGGGTAVLTRYTLRLLTVDQFYRAVLLACSCEKVREDTGEELKDVSPITVGLWVGKDACPNTLNDAANALKKISKGSETPFESNPMKLKVCPWCGTELEAPDYKIESRSEGMKIRCPDRHPDITCPFSKDFPVWIIDEDVYRERPSMIIGTVDKFARLPWLEEAGNIFGTDNKNPPPELIIQDELHLISGPLGTLVGIYETAVDLLCKKGNNFGPKIIASTATIRNAQNQVISLFSRNVRQFPQPGLDYRDSFFSVEDKSKPARIYAGVFTPSLSPTTALIRTFGCLLHAVKILDFPDKIKDAYWTLMGYFLSLRELGGARRHIEDDVKDYLKFCEERDVKDKRKQKPRPVDNVEELTSRAKSWELDMIRKNLWDEYPDENCLDAVLATNMISVGLDVPRLGLMTVIGQPKSTSEYIQASSRIGRQHPGLVVNVYKWTHSRDRSHYERFKSYHSKLYSEVEATSVTPFSIRSRERALHAVLVALIRHLVPELSKNEAAIKFSSGNSEVQAILSEVKKRIEKIDVLEIENAEKDIDRIIDTWDYLSNQCPDLCYWHYKNRSLLRFAEDRDKKDKSFPTMNSLRNIDPPVGLYLTEI